MKSLLPVKPTLPTPSRLIFILLIITAFFLPSPYVILSPGNPQNILGSAITISGTKVYPTTGKLSVTSVLVTDPDSYITGFDVLYGWIDKNRVVLPRALGMGDALSNVISSNSSALPTEFMGSENNSPAQQEMMKAMFARLLRGFMGSLIATQLGQGVGLLANSITGANDVAIPLQNGAEVAHLIPQNIVQWSDGLGIDPEQVGIYLSLREAAAARLFANNKWLSKYIQDVITAYGKGISIDVESITRQAEEAMASGEIDINNPNAINIALNSGLFTPQQTPAQELALTKLEMALALIEGWIDHVISEVASERMPAFNALIENSRRRRATNSPMQQIFATLLALEVSPRKMREASAFWSEVKQLRGADGRDKCWQDAAFLPMPDDLKDVKAFLDSVTVPDDLSGLL